jgi:hypothetical protein
MIIRIFLGFLHLIRQYRYRSITVKLDMFMFSLSDIFLAQTGLVMLEITTKEKVNKSGANDLRRITSARIESSLHNITLNNKTNR